MALSLRTWRQQADIESLSHRCGAFPQLIKTVVRPRYMPNAEILRVWSVIVLVCLHSKLYLQLHNNSLLE